MKLLRNNLLLTVVFGGYFFFFSTHSTTQGFIVKAAIVNILVKKVHEPQWRIGYNFVFGCNAFKPKEKELKAAMTKSLRVWLQPLRELYPDKVFTDDFLFVRLPDMKECWDNREAARQVDIRITFTCQVAVSGALVGGVDTPEVCMRKGTAINRFFLLSLAHELGHAFGMGDTYARGIAVSTGGLAHTEGKQPSSIMAGLPGLQRRRPFPYLKEDDKNGIIWLYKYYHEDQPAGDCFFPDHVPVENVLGLKTLRGCEPRYPLIYEVKHGAVQNVLTILRDDPNLDLNGRDYGGNTALHYAVRRGQVEIVEELLKQAGIKVNITNKKGRSPAQLARRIKRRDLARLIEAHRTAKLPLWSVEAREKLATIWGQLKQRD